MVLRLLVAAVLVASVLCLPEPRRLGVGRCMKVDQLPYFNADKFLGNWYIIERVGKNSRCQTMDYTRISPTQLQVTSQQQFHILDQVGVDHTTTYTGTIDLPKRSNSSPMRIRWPHNLIRSADYSVFDTDYATYAGVFQCRRTDAGNLVHAWNAALLSRTPTLDPAIIEKMKRRLRSFGVQTDRFRTVVHAHCTAPANADVFLHLGTDYNRQHLPAYSQVVANTYNTPVKVVHQYVAVAPVKSTYIAPRPVATAPTAPLTPIAPLVPVQSTYIVQRPIDLAPIVPAAPVAIYLAPIAPSAPIVPAAAPIAHARPIQITPHSTYSAPVAQPAPAAYVKQQPTTIREHSFNLRASGHITATRNVASLQRTNHAFIPLTDVRSNIVQTVSDVVQTGSDVVDAALNDVQARLDDVRERLDESQFILHGNLVGHLNQRGSTNDVGLRTVVKIH